VNVLMNQLNRIAKSEFREQHEKNMESSPSYRAGVEAFRKKRSFTAPDGMFCVEKQAWYDGYTNEKYPEDKYDTCRKS